MQHHANLLVGAKGWAYTLLPSMYLKQNHDIRHLDFDNLNIKDARGLIAESNLKAVEGGAHVFVINARRILREAQNTLLKLFEDPNPNTIYYLIIPSENLLLPTLRSRLFLLASDTHGESDEAFVEFQDLPYKERLSLIQSKIKDDDDFWFESVVSGFENYAHKMGSKALIEDAVMLGEYTHMQGHSKKILLEHIALSL